MALSKPKRIGILVAIGVLLVSMAVGSYFYFGYTSEGFRAGTVIKLSRKGYVFKTYEGEMNLNQGGNSLEKFVFSVEENEEGTLKTLDQVAVTGERVKIYYREMILTLPWRGDTNYLVYKIETINDQTAPKEEKVGE
ncbi:hypothetical protein [Hugenholtzia roseola]|uniref:hypothetical protein n=1 Tax=Hugenholtzia roseola TaxID=1002 RepID=UPI0003FCA8AA|nr:hypothetical protein [Hugenholtzia roseola]